eukprot:CAMPEP_0177763334 /NCGR_PEP_ID=MMETSP0491_2-20121128/6815_1 /TAXON_ID=63592 /ORGANISM="Tetraselmis chuii, Strain PLY429" /LENGTH=195 /DNA_ID=CAMNT_0019279433 /DNA_START=406 /DNA_END=994 /DNA_ORIENTATION=+
MASSGAHHDAACPTSPTSSGRFAECGSHDYIIPSSCSDDFPSFSETSERKQRGGRRALSLLRSASFAGDAHSSDYTDEVTLSDFERQLTTRRFSYDQRATRDFLYSPEGTERAVRGGCIALDVLSLDEEEISEFLSSDGDSLYCGTPMDVTPVPVVRAPFFRQREFPASEARGDNTITASICTAGISVPFLLFAV